MPQSFLISGYLRKWWGGRPSAAGALGMCGGAGATTADITEPDWRLSETGAIDEKEIADCLKPS
jgi:hypothetical protein